MFLGSGRCLYYLLQLYPLCLVKYHCNNNSECSAYSLLVGYVNKSYTDMIQASSRTIMIFLLLFTFQQWRARVCNATLDVCHSVLYANSLGTESKHHAVYVLLSFRMKFPFSLKLFFLVSQNFTINIHTYVHNFHNSDISA